MLRNEWQEIDAGIYQMKKYMKTKRIREKEEKKKIIIKTIILAVVFFTMYGLIIYFGAKATMNLG